MKTKEWLCQLSKRTGLPYYEEHKLFGGKAGALIGTSEGYIVALGVGKAGRRKAVKVLLRYANTQDPSHVKLALDPARGKFKPVTGGTTAALTRTYSFSRPDPSDVADQLRNLLAALKTSASPINGKCEKCGKAEPDLILLNDVPTHYCSACQAQFAQNLDAAATAYENLESNLPRGLACGIGAALAGGLAWGGFTYLSHQVSLWGTFIIGVFVSIAVVKGSGKVTWTSRVMIGLLTIASVVLGDSVFYALTIAKESQIPFGVAMKFVAGNFLKIETNASGGIVSMLFALIAAGTVMYATREPAFKAQFVTLGTPATALSSATTEST